MAIGTSNGFSGPYTGNGSTTAFPFTFSVLSGDQVAVQVDGATVSSSEYSVSLSSAAPSIGTVTFAIAPANGTTIYTYLNPEFTQDIEFADGAAWLAKPVNDGYDQSALRDQALKRDVSRALLLPIGDSSSALPATNDRKGGYLAFDADGKPVIASGTGNDPDFRSDASQVAGAALVGADDGAGGSLFTSVQSFVTYLLSSAGSSLVGWVRAATGAVVKKVSVKLGLRLDAEDFFPNNWDPASTVVTAYLQAAIDESAASKRTLYLPARMMCGAITLTAGASLLGVANRSQITWIAGNYIGITLAGSDVSIRSLVSVATAKTGGEDITIACGTSQKDRITIADIISYDSFGMLTDSGSGAGVHATTIVKDYQAKRLRGHGINLTRALAFLWHIRVTPDYVGSASPDYVGFKLSGVGLGGAAGGYNFIDCHVLGTKGVTDAPNQVAFDLSDLSAVWITNCMGDTVCSDAWRVTNVNGIHGDGMIGSLMDGHCGVFTGVSGEIARFAAYGRNYLSSPATGKDGIRLVSGCAALHFIAPTVRNMTGYSIDQTAAQAGVVTVTAPQFFDNTLLAVKAVGASALNIVGGNFGGNAGGEYDLASALHLISQTQGNSGGRLAVTGPAVG